MPGKRVPLKFHNLYFNVVSKRGVKNRGLSKTKGGAAERRKWGSKEVKEGRKE